MSFRHKCLNRLLQVISIVSPTGRLADPSRRTSCGYESGDPLCISVDSWWAGRFTYTAQWALAFLRESHQPKSLGIETELKQSCSIFKRNWVHHGPCVLYVTLQDLRATVLVMIPGGVFSFSGRMKAVYCQRVGPQKESWRLGGCSQ